MENRKFFKLVTGNEAYNIWYVYNDCDIEIDKLMEVEANLELVVGSSGEVYANRSNLIFPFTGLSFGSGAWEFTEDSDSLSKSDLRRLKVICRNFTFN